MAIDVSHIHNLVRTYHRALHDTTELKQQAPASAGAAKEDHVSVSAEARQRIEQSHHRGKKA